MTYHMNTRVTVARTEQDIQQTFRQWGVSDARYSIEYNVTRQRMHNLTLSRDERGVTITWTPRGGQPITVGMRDHDTIGDNLRVLYLALEAMRMNEKRGLGSTMQSAYIQLEAPSALDPYMILGIEATDMARGLSFDETKGRYRIAARDAHPDTGGTDEAFRRVNDAWKQVQTREGWS